MFDPETNKVLAQLQRERSDRIRAEREAKAAEDIDHLKWTVKSSVEFAEALKSDFGVTIRRQPIPKPSTSRPTRQKSEAI